MKAETRYEFSKMSFTDLKTMQEYCYNEKGAGAMLKDKERFDSYGSLWSLIDKEMRLRCDKIINLEVPNQ